jgi:DNA-binding transcriptional MerR regulator
MPYKEKAADDLKLYYSIGEISKMFNVNASLIRFWEKEFEIIQPKKNNKGNRMFTREDVANFQTIFHLVKEKGFTLDGAKRKLKESANPKENSSGLAPEWISRLKEIRAALSELRNEE